jgi:L-alanine-DL-glutamate epimerase-like enolase superfamily enzyme
MYDLSAVDIALWDNAGKAALATAFRLLVGGGSDLPATRVGFAIQIPLTPR